MSNPVNKQKRSRHKALIILDMLNTFDFNEADQLLAPATIAAKNIARLKKRAYKKNIPVIYVNDNFGRWRSDWKIIYDECTREERKGREIAHILKPQANDYFILKPKHSGFYSTTLEVLLEQLKIDTVILTGIAGNICVLFTANDAHMREYNVIVPKDSIACNKKSDTKWVIAHLNTAFGIKTPTVESLRL